MCYILFRSTIIAPLRIQFRKIVALCCQLFDAKIEKNSNWEKQAPRMTQTRSRWNRFSFIDGSEILTMISRTTAETFCVCLKASGDGRRETLTNKPTKDCAIWMYSIVLLMGNCLKMTSSVNHPAVLKYEMFIVPHRVTSLMGNAETLLCAPIDSEVFSESSSPPRKSQQCVGIKINTIKCAFRVSSPRDLFSHVLQNAFESNCVTSSHLMLFVHLLCIVTRSSSVVEETKQSSDENACEATLQAKPFTGSVMLHKQRRICSVSEHTLRKPRKDLITDWKERKQRANVIRDWHLCSVNKHHWVIYLPFNMSRFFVVKNSLWIIFWHNVSVRNSEKKMKTLRLTNNNSVRRAVIDERKPTLSLFIPLLYPERYRTTFFHTHILTFYTSASEREQKPRWQSCNYVIARHISRTKKIV